MPIFERERSPWVDPRGLGPVLILGRISIYIGPDALRYDGSSGWGVVIQRAKVGKGGT